MSFIPISQPTITQKEIDYITDAAKSGWVSSMGEYINTFERQFAAFCGCKYAVSTSNGTTALHLALVALGIKAGDEVIIPDLTFIATANAVKYTGADVVTVDIDEDSFMHRPIGNRERHYSEDQSHYPRPSLRTSRQYGGNQKNCRQTQSLDRRRCGGSTRCGIQWRKSG